MIDLLPVHSLEIENADKKFVVGSVSEKSGRNVAMMAMGFKK